MRMRPPPADRASRQHEFARRDRRNREPATIPPSLPMKIRVSLLRPEARFRGISDMPHRSRVRTSGRDRSTGSFSKLIVAHLELAKDTRSFAGRLRRISEQSKANSEHTIQAKSPTSRKVREKWGTRR